MNKRAITILALVLVSFVCLNSHAAEQVRAGKGGGLKVHLPREMVIDSETLVLGYISVLNGDEGLALKAADVVLGRFVIPGQAVTIDRATILSRLVNSGIDKNKIQMTGAEKVTVTQELNVVTADEFTKFALKFLKTKIPNPETCIIEVKSLPTSLVLADMGREVKLTAQLLNSKTVNRPRVRVIATSEGKELRRTDLTFQLRFNSRAVIARVAIPAGTVLTEKNIAIKKIISDVPEPLDFKVPYGNIAKRNLAANTIVKDTMIKAPAKEMVVERNQTVIIKVDLPGFLITATGTTMQGGRSGDFIKVRNVDSQRIITVQVNADGTVKPII